MEEWRHLKINNIDTGWEISSNGNFKRKNKTITTGSLHKSGYKRVFINHKTYDAHKLVALIFIPNPDNLPEIDHINTIKTDNRVENLRWCTRTENMNNILTKNKLATIERPHSKKHPLSKLYKCINTGEINTTYYFSKKYNLKQQSIRDAARLRQSLYNMIFEEAMNGKETI